MFTLRTLGGLRLENGADPPVTRAAQRRRLALLVVLSLAPDKRVSRNRLVLLLWPDMSEEQARARLSGAIYDVRQFLGEHAITSTGDDVQLTASELRTDVELWDAAMQRSDWETARTLYGGPFLDGVHIGGAPEFDEWSSAMRDRLLRRHRDALARAATARAESGDAAAAVERWRELYGLDPLDVRVTLALMRALVACGQRSEAIRLATESARLLRAELGADADVEVQAFAEQLRREWPGSGASMVTASRAPARSISIEPAAAAEPSAPTPPDGAAFARHAPLPTRNGAMLGLGGVTVALLVTLAVIFTSRRTIISNDVTAPVHRVAVFPFVTTHVNDSTLGVAFAELLRTGLDASLTGASVVERLPIEADVQTGDRSRAQEIATRLGADRLVLGSVTGDGDTLRVKATFYDRQTGNIVAEARTDLARDGLVLAVDDITRQFVAADLQGPAVRLASVGVLTTQSTAAMRAFIAGETHFRAGRFLQAVPAYQRAVDEDSTFALAHYRLSLAIIWGNVPLNALALHDSLALAYSGRLSTRERSLVRAYVSWRHGDGAAARAAYHALAQRYPDDVDAWHQEGEAIFHYSPVDGHPIGEARTSFETVLHLDATHWGASWHLALLDAMERGRPTFLAQVPRLLARSPDSATALGVRLLAADASGSALRNMAKTADGFALLEGAWRRGVYLRDLDGAEVLYRELLSPGRDAYSVAKGAFGLAEIALGRGQWDAAWTLVRQHDNPLTYRHGLTTMVQAAVLPVFARSQDDLITLSREVDRWRLSAASVREEGTEVRVGATYLQALLDAARGDSSRALQQAATILRDSSTAADERRQAAMTVRAFVSYQAGRYVETMARLDSATLHRWFGDATAAPWLAQTFQRFLRAESLRALGRWQDAVHWYDSLEQYAPSDVACLGLMLLGRGNARRALGDSSAARADNERFATLWRAADPRYRGLVRSADARLAGR